MKSTKKEKKQYKKAFQEAMARELREHKSSFIVFSILRILVLVVLVRQIMLANYEGAFFCILTLLLLYVPSWIQVKLRIELPPPLEITIFCFIFAAEILGEVNAFYVVIPGWDTMLHTINGFLAAAVGFSMVMLLNDDDRITFHLSPAFLALVAFCFSMTIGVLWEFFEFGMDFFLGTDMQKDTIVNQISSVSLDPTNSNISITVKGIKDVILVTDSGEQALGLGGFLDIGLYDTMEDLFVNFVGAVVFSVLNLFVRGVRYAEQSDFQVFFDFRKTTVHFLDRFGQFSHLRHDLRSILTFFFHLRNLSGYGVLPVFHGLYLGQKRSSLLVVLLYVVQAEVAFSPELDGFFYALKVFSDSFNI